MLFVYKDIIEVEKTKDTAKLGEQRFAEEVKEESKRPPPK